MITPLNTGMLSVFAKELNNESYDANEAINELRTCEEVFAITTNVICTL